MKFLFLILIFSVDMTQASLQGLPESAEKADRNASLNRVIKSFPRTLNPIIYTSADEDDIFSNVFDLLVKVDPDTGEPVCWLCESFTYDQKSKVATFKLEKNVKWHDGKPFTARDVAFSLRAMMHPKVDNLNWKNLFLSTIAKTEVVDDLNVKVFFKENKFSNIYRLETYIIPEHAFPGFDKNPEKFNKNTKFSKNPIGTGPYKIKKSTKSKVELSRVKNWWGDSREKFKNAFNFKTVRFKVITDDNVALQSFKKGNTDFTNLQSFEYDELIKSKETKLPVEPVHFQPKVGTSFMFISWNSRLPKFSDRKTRHALSLLADRFSTLKKFSKGLRPPTNGSVGIKSDFQCPEKKCPVVPFDVKKGRALLKEAGWSDTDNDGTLDRVVAGEKQNLRFTILASQGDYAKNVLGVYVNEYKKSGINAKIKQLDWTAMNSIVDDQKFDAFFSGFRSGYPVNYRQLWHSDNAGKKGSNTWNFVDKEADKLMEAFEQTFDTQARIKIGQKIHEKIYNSHVALFHHEGGGCYVGKSKKLNGMKGVNYSTDCIYWPRWYKAKK